jgi:hypothetical protein
MLRLIAPPMLCLLMGFAMQRGSTCCLAAVYELLHGRRGTRLSIAEAALWVLAISGLAGAFGIAIGWPSFAELAISVKLHAFAKPRLTGSLVQRGIATSKIVPNDRKNLDLAHCSRRSQSRACRATACLRRLQFASAFRVNAGWS